MYKILGRFVFFINIFEDLHLKFLIYDKCYYWTDTGLLTTFCYCCWPKIKLTEFRNFVLAKAWISVGPCSSALEFSQLLLIHEALSYAVPQGLLYLLTQLLRKVKVDITK